MNKQLTKNKNQLSALMLGLISCGSVLAYDSNDDSDITTQRQSSVYAQQGIHAGAFTILPKLVFAAVTLQRPAMLEGWRMNSPAGAWEPGGSWGMFCEYGLSQKRA
jgi:hypothetical protein